MTPANTEALARAADGGHLNYSEQRAKAAAERAAWLASLKVGDEVALDTGAYDCGLTILKVIRLTAAQMMLEAEGRSLQWRARRSDGMILGGSRYRKIDQPTDEVRQRIAKAELERWARYHLESEVRGLPTEKLARLREFVEALKA